MNTLTYIFALIGLMATLDAVVTAIVDAYKAIQGWKLLMREREQ